MLHTKFRDFEKSLKESFDNEDLTPGLAAPDTLLDEPEATPALRTSGGGAIADDAAIDLTKKEGTLGSLLQPLLDRTANMSVPAILAAFKGILEELNASGKNKTAKKWLNWIRENQKVSHSSLIHTLYSLYLAAASLDVSGKGILGGGRSRHDF